MGPGYGKNDLRELRGDLLKIGKSEKVCGYRLGKRYLTGYCKAWLAALGPGRRMVVVDVISNLPQADVQGGYDDVETLYAIAHLLDLRKLSVTEKLPGSCRFINRHSPNCLMYV